MKIRQFKSHDFSSTPPPNFSEINPELILVFSDTQSMEDTNWLKSWHQAFPTSILLGCSTSGNILGAEISETGFVATAIEMEKTQIKYAVADLSETVDRFQAGIQLSKDLDFPELKYVLVISEGTNVNGSDLVSGLNKGLGGKVPVTGGLSGDGARFQKTIVSLNGESAEGRIVAIGFYGEDFQVSYGTWGGWDAFGVERKVTKAENNIVYQIDNRPALELYKEFLGEYAKDLPGSGLRFPLLLRDESSDAEVIRTIIGIDHEKGSMTFAGNIPQASKVRLMKANFDRLVDGASIAADLALKLSGERKPELAIIVSCIGRKIVLGPRVEDELEEVSYVLGNELPITGFYSYGEISPVEGFGKCSLHNQSMTVTTLGER